MDQALRTPASNEFGNGLESIRSQVVNDTNIAIYFSTENKNIINRTLKEIESLGFIPFEICDIFTCLYFVCKSKGVDVDLSDTEEQLVDMLHSIHIATVDHEIEFIYIDNGTKRPIDIESLSQQETEKIKLLIKENIHRNSQIFKLIINKIENFLKSHRSIAYYSSDYINYISVNGPILLISDEPERDRRTFYFRIIQTNEVDTISGQILESLLADASYKRKRADLKASINNGQIATYPRFDTKNIPQDPLIKRIRKALTPILEDFLVTHKYKLFDPIDLKYQVLFRLTTFDIEELFEDGILLRKYLDKLNVSSDWKNILTINEGHLEQFQLREEILKRTIDEQFRIIINRLQHSDLPIHEIFEAKKYPKEEWRVETDSKGIRLINVSHADQKSIDLYFRVVENTLARKIFSQLHYIHDPVSEFSLGLFERNNEIPLSVLGIYRDISVTRQNILLAYGYDPSKCLYFSRMYHRPEAPFNLSSVMLSLAIKHIKESLPDTQAVVTAFMPSFAAGLSMTSAGFAYTVSLKSHKLFFSPSSINGVNHFSYTTGKNIDTETITNKIPVLPSMLLLRQINRPTYKPLPELQKSIITYYS